MNAYFEIAYAAASGKLSFFTGTGFSKAISNGIAPGWQALLEAMCAKSTKADQLRNSLFPPAGKNPLPLEEAAQVVEIELNRESLSLDDEIAALISSVPLAGNNSAISTFLTGKTFDVVTTNYDQLFEKLVGSDNCHSITPGLPIPRSHSPVRVYHVHGSIDSPRQMVVTSDDYFRFLNGDSYFSRKLSTILHETTVVILGYSLGDTNLKSILSDYKGFSRSHVIGGNIFLVSRDHVAQYIKDYYAHSFGIRVLDNLGIHDFFELISQSMPAAESCATSSRNNIRKVVFENHFYTDDYLKVELSFFEIIASISAVGISINLPRVVQLIGKIIEKKTAFTTANNAWDQYTQLAKWLLYLATLIELRGTSIEKAYLQAVLRSMTTMRSSTYIGYSWHAYGAWSGGWPSVIPSNRAMIRAHIEANTQWPDALTVVRSA
jgi:hypothetical protein